MVLLAVAAFVLQYSGINFRVFVEMRFELRHSLGRLAEMLPCVVAGYLLGYLGTLGMDSHISHHFKGAHERQLYLRSAE